VPRPEKRMDIARFAGCPILRGGVGWAVEARKAPRFRSSSRVLLRRPIGIFATTRAFTRNRHEIRTQSRPDARAGNRTSRVNRLIIRASVIAATSGQGSLILRAKSFLTCTYVSVSRYETV
jgi:hypothetical protein